MKLFQKLLEKYKFVTPVPKSVQKKVVSSRHNNIKKILQRFGNYSLVFGLMLWIKKLAMKAGFELSFFQCKVILVIVSATFAGSVGIGGYTVAKDYLEQKKAETMIENTKSIEKTSNKKQQKLMPKTEERKPLAATKPRIGFQPLQSANTELAEKVTGKILSNMRKRLKEYKIQILPLTQRDKVLFFVTGSIRVIDKTTYVTLKLVDVKNSSVLLIADEKMQDRALIDTVSKKLADRIVQKLQ